MMPTKFSYDGLTKEVRRLCCTNSFRKARDLVAEHSGYYRIVGLKRYIEESEANYRSAERQQSPSTPDIMPVIRRLCQAKHFQLTHDCINAMASYYTNEELVGFHAYVDGFEQGVADAK